MPSCLSDAERQLTSLHAKPLLAINWAPISRFFPDSSLNMKGVKAGLRVGLLLPWLGNDDIVIVVAFIVH